MSARMVRSPAATPRRPRSGRQSMKEIDLTGIVAEHIDAINAGDTDRAVATFAEDAYVNDNRREFVGIDAIRRWVTKEMVGDKVTIDVREVLDHYGDTVVRGAYDGTFDRTNLPDEIVLTNYFSVRDGKIVSLAIIFNQPVDYCPRAAGTRELTGGCQRLIAYDVRQMPSDVRSGRISLRFPPDMATCLDAWAAMMKFA